ncbi:hypothetical protein [Herbaspirillum sp. C7C8]|uniref:hypothetical protein n=1 Tax=Herbaspirillum sp. C7C8 TaxID=2736665 RepID=UPI001F51B552|nr:hypothetical protein [Herbaspirillum sp. C7C8]MCI1005213.1 hypothetical protein [Herbaspirillum sp. C7C8]
MAEVNTTQGAKIVNRTPKLLPHESFGRKRILASKMPATYAQLAINDTIFIGRVPAGSRFTLNSKVSCAAGTASSTLDIGIRSTSSGTVIDADGLAASVNTNAAGQKDANTGALIASGAEYVTTEEVDVYATVTGAVLAANQALKFEIEYVND